MGFILKENTTYVHCKLTDAGRRKIAEGKFNPTKFSIGDSEINYTYFNENNYNIEDTIIVSPKDKYKKIEYPIKKNITDVVPIYDIDGLIFTGNTYNRDVDDIGFFSGDTYNHKAHKGLEYVRQGDIRIDNAQFNSNNNREIDIIKSLNYGFNSNEPEIGDYLLINWNNPLNTGTTFQEGIIDSDNISPFIWYKIISKNGLLSDNTLTVNVDRDLPNFGTGSTGTTYSYAIIYPKFNSMEDFYNSIYISDYWTEGSLDFVSNCNTSPKDSNIWNMNIFYSDELIGLKNIQKSLKYRESSKYAGFLTYISDSGTTHNNIGIIHYTNNKPSNLYGENFENDIEINLPTILWHKNEDNKIGLKLIADNTLKSLSNYNLQYYDLIDNWNNIIGKVFPDMKIIVIEDQEMLHAMSYKSNRNWTLNEPNVDFNINSCFGNNEQFDTFYYGTYEVLGGIVDIPQPSDINMNNGTAVNSVNLFSFGLSIPFNSSSDDFIWFAIPDSYPIRTKWYVNSLNNGDIGGIKDISGNLFPDPEQKTFNSINYTIYISNYRTTAETINMLLS